MHGSGPPWWVELIVSWLPFIFLVAVFLWFWRKGIPYRRGPSGATVVELYEQQVAEWRRVNVMLERIATALEKRER